jgi:hypothetical protein
MIVTSFAAVSAILMFTVTAVSPAQLVAPREDLNVSESFSQKPGTKITWMDMELDLDEGPRPQTLTVQFPWLWFSRKFDNGQWQNFGLDTTDLVPPQPESKQVRGHGSRPITGRAGYTLDLNRWVFTVDFDPTSGKLTDVYMSPDRSQRPIIRRPGMRIIRNAPVITLRQPA